MRRLLALLLLAVAGCGGGEEPRAAPPIVEALRQGDLVLVLRHAATEQTTDEREFLRSCELQRNLSGAGRAQAREIGKALRALRVPVGEVRASPMCRTRDTARLAFNRVTIDRQLVSPGVVGTFEDDERRKRALRRVVRRGPRADGNLVLVTHTGNIGALGEETTVEGELLAYERGRLVGRVRPEAWPALVRAATGPRE